MTKDTSPWHAGEQALQARLGLRERLEEVGRVVMRDHMPEQHRELFGKLPTLLLGALDAEGQPWATMLHGRAGFVSSPDARTLRVMARPAADDPVAPCLAEGAAVGLLGLEPHTRRRNRANGRVRSLHEGGFEVQVLQSFGNCPKYIHARRPETAASHRAAPARRLGPGLDDASLALLRRADTLFIATSSAARPGGARADGVDVSHRGGRPGFVRVDAEAVDGADRAGYVGHADRARSAKSTKSAKSADRTPGGATRLTVPDYAGNAFFNTLGNLLAWPQAGLLVPDYDDGSLLHLAARATIEFDGPALVAFPGAQRLLHLDVLQGWWRPGALPLRWSLPEAPAQFAS